MIYIQFLKITSTSKHTENRGSSILGWREKWAKSKDYRKKCEAIIIRAQSITKNTNYNTKIINTMTTINTHFTNN